MKSSKQYPACSKIKSLKFNFEEITPSQKKSLALQNLAASSIELLSTETVPTNLPAPTFELVNKA